MSEEERFDADGLEEPYPERAFGRKDFLFDTGKLLAAAAAAGPFFMAEKQAEAAICASSGGAGSDPIASRAVQAAKQFSGRRIAMTYEVGLQALDPKNFSGPLWKRLTGVDTSIVEGPFPQLYSRAIAEHVARSGKLDVLDVSPVWIPDFADRGVIAPLDNYIRRYRAQRSLTDIHPLYRALGRYKGRTWGFYDDGDIWILYYRKDIFANASLRRDYRAQYKRDLRVPQSWDEFSRVAAFITEKMAPRVYGTGMGRALGNPGNQFYFFQQFRANGGQFFNPSTMKAQINNAIGVRTMRQILAQNRASIPGIEKLDFVSGWANWLRGKTAMMMAWPPTGRISENISQRNKAFAFLPKSRVVGKVGYAIVPGRNGEHAGAFVKCVSADSKNRDLAYLWCQWMTSPSISLQRVMLPYALRDPYRLSHFTSPQYRRLWRNANEYLETLCEGANHGVLDPIMTGAADYANALDRAMTAIYAGKDVKEGLDEAAAEWDRITDRLGRDKQRASYREFLKLPGATGRNTVARRGQSARC